MARTTSSRPRSSCSNVFFHALFDLDHELRVVCGLLFFDLVGLEPAPTGSRCNKQPSFDVVRRRLGDGRRKGDRAPKKDVTDRPEPPLHPPARILGVEFFEKRRRRAVARMLRITAVRLVSRAAFSARLRRAGTALSRVFLCRCPSRSIGASEAPVSKCVPRATSACMVAVFARLRLRALRLDAGCSPGGAIYEEEFRRFTGCPGSHDCSRNAQPAQENQRPHLSRKNKGLVRIL